MTESHEEQLRRMVMTFRVSELQMLLGFAGKNKIGRKNELQTRAIGIVKLRNPAIHAKIRKLYKNIQLEMMSFGDRSQVAGGAPTPILSAQKAPMSLSTIAGYAQSVSGGGGINATISAPRYTVSTPQVASSGALSTAASYTSALTSNLYAVNPNVKLKRLPFYDIISELLKPSTLSPQVPGRYPTFAFSLSPQQANKLANSRDLRPGKQDYCVQVQMRFCLLETTCEQEDSFPPNVAVKINEKLCPLPTPVPTNKPGVEPKRPSRPVNVTALCRISPTVNNTIQVSWASEYGRLYVISVFLVQKLTSEDLLQRLKNKGVKRPDYTRSLIKQKLQEDADCEIATTSLRCSLMCPLGKMRMIMPCRASTCDHLQCFDASLYLQMNERKPTWTCPVCDKPALYDNLVIDGYFQEMLQENMNSNEVTLHKDGSWSPLLPKKETKEPEVVKRKLETSVETLSDDSDDEIEDQFNGPTPVAAEVSNNKKNAEMEVITLSDSDDDDPSPPAKRTKTGLVSVAASSPTTSATSASCNGTSGGGGAPYSSYVSSGAVSPQVICLDSPTSSPSPPTRRLNQGPSPLPAGTTMTPVISSTPASSFSSVDQRQVISVTSRLTPPVTTTNSRQSPIPHTTIIPLSSAATTSASASRSITSNSSLLPPSPSPSFSMRGSSSAAAAAAAAAVAELTGINSNPYTLTPSLQNLFSPLGLMPPTTVSSTLPYRPQDRYM
ncbi:hypothetical protein Pcinc_032610 [Petrolisthes cinctipes]|uniref:E3 SUMO-protein ligase PIAS2 n=1 Tax=Petrolisthes cinctipes TaxID=88211 RepID=A0AAE1ETY7_PETCI|nr:hypothetical protein Pcinc_032610 [Petrolisthes cinctipes]